MSFFSKIKQGLGIGTVKVTLNAPGTFRTDDGTIEGSVNLVAKSDQNVLAITIKLDEEYTEGKGNDKKTKTYEIGKLKMDGFEMKAGDVKDVPFVLQFTYAKSSNQALADRGGVLGGLGKLGSFVQGEKSTFKLWATCDVKGAALDPNDLKEIRAVK